jgi:hypothetical protein
MTNIVPVFFIQIREVGGGLGVQKNLAKFD